MCWRQKGNHVPGDSQSTNNSQGTLRRLIGISPGSENRIRRVAPYWRLAAQKELGPHYVSLGTFSLAADLYPGQDRSADGKEHCGGRETGFC